MEATVLSFIDAACADVAAAGGKGANLSLMTRAGLPVPPGFVVATEAYRDFVSSTGIAASLFDIVDGLARADATALEGASVRIRALFASAPMPAATRERILRAYRELGGDDFVAVRSSGTAEDMSGASFAGLHDTYLDIQGGDAVVDAVRNCWSSMWSARALAYRRSGGFDNRQVSIAVVVQRMVESEVSGVLFTANPLEARTTEFVVNANYGLGESIVSGHVDPDEYVLAADDLRSLRYRAGAREFKIVRASAPAKGTCHAEVTDADRARPCLDESQLIQLGELGRKVMAYYGGIPQDIEWAFAGGRLYALQSRPVTGADFLWEECIEAAAQNPPDNEQILWTLRWAEAYWTGGISPLHFSVRVRHYRKSMEYMAEITGFPELKGQPYFRWHRGTVYYNCNYHNGLANSVIPSYARGPYLETVPESWRQESMRRPLDFPRFIRAVLSVNSSSLHSVFTWKSTQRSYIDGRIAEATTLPKATLQRMSDDALKREALRLEELMHAYCDSLWMGYNILFPNVFGLFAQMIERFYKGSNKLILQDLISGNPTRTQQSVETNALFDLARSVRSSPALLAAYRSHKGAAFFEHLTSFDEGRAWLERYGTFIVEHGHRGAAERDIYYRRRADDPAIDYEAFGPYLGADEPASPEVVERRVAEGRERATRELHEALRSQPFGELLLNVFRLLHQWVLDFLCIRDDSRHYADRMTLAKRWVYLEIARRCVERGTLKEADDCFFLADTELYELLHGRGSVALANAKIAGRRKAFMKVDARKAGLPLYVQGGKPVDFDATTHDGSSTLKGVGLSGGVITGRARVVPDLAEIGRVQKDDILICNATDPGWASVFTLIKGLVIETGGMLAHGACLSREHGIPAVQLRSAMQIIPDGATVRLRGETGEIELVKD